MAIRSLSSRTLVFETAQDYTDAVTKGMVLPEHHAAYLSYAATGQPQWLRGKGDALTVDPADSTEITQVSGASSGGSSYRKVQATTDNTALTFAAHNHSILHVEAGATLASPAMLAANWMQGGGFLATDFFILNNSGIALSLAVETGAGKFSGLLEVPGDGVAGFEIPNQYMAHVFTDADGWVQATLAGEAVTQVELENALLLKVNTSSIVTSIGTADAVAVISTSQGVRAAIIADRGALQTEITTSATLVWGGIYDVRSTGNDIILTLPVSTGAWDERDILINRIDNLAAVVAVAPSAGATLLGVPAGTQYIALAPGGAIRCRATASGPRKVSWAGIASVARAWRPSDLATAPALAAHNEDLLTLGAGSMSGTWGGMSQATTANRPVITLAAMNSYPVVTFDGTDDFLARTANLLHRSVFMVYRATAVMSNVQNDAWFFGHPTTYHYHPGTTGTLVGDSMHMHANLKHAGGVRFDGGTAGNPTAVSFPQNTTAHMVQFVATADVEWQYFGGNDRNTSTRFANAEVAELYVWVGAAPTDTIREQMEGAAAWRYGLVASLPTGHKYKNVPPMFTLAAY